MSWIRVSAKSTIIFLVTLLVLVPGSVSAAGPGLLVPYEGFLTNAAGQPIDASQNITFRFFTDETGGTALFEESRLVTVEDGVFQTIIGDASTIIPTELAGHELFLEIQISGDPSPLSPRQRVRIPGTPAPELKVTAISDDESLFEGRRARLGPNIVQENDTVVKFRGRGFDGVRYRQLGDIRFRVDGTPGIDDMPGRLEFRTTPDGSDSAVTQMTIKSTGNVGIGTETPGQLLDLESKDEAIVSAYTKSDTEESSFVGRRSRALETIVQDGDKLVRFIGGDSMETAPGGQRRFVTLWTVLLG